MARQTAAEKRAAEAAEAATEAIVFDADGASSDDPIVGDEAPVFGEDGLDQYGRTRRWWELFGPEAVEVPAEG